MSNDTGIFNVGERARKMREFAAALADLPDADAAAFFASISDKPTSLADRLTAMRARLLADAEELDVAANFAQCGGGLPSLVRLLRQSAYDARNVEHMIGVAETESSR